MGRPLGSKNRRKPAATTKPRRINGHEVKPKKLCTACNKLQTVSNFYVSASPLYDGYAPLCKECAIKECIDEEGNINIEGFKKILRIFDRPFVQKLLDASELEVERDIRIVDKSTKAPVIQRYFKSVQSLTSFSKLTWQDGIEKEKIERYGTNEKPAEIILSKPSDEPVFDDFDPDEFAVTQELIDKWGFGLSTREYALMEKKYNFLSQSYNVTTAMHSEALCSYIKYKVKEELCIARDDVDSAERWSSLASKASQKAKIDPSQLTKNDSNVGLNSWAEIFQAVEEHDDILEILPKFKYRPQDSVDFLLLEYVNFIRRLDGKPLVDYEEIWQYYDKRKADFIEKYGSDIFDGDPTESNRKNIAKFVTMPVDYNE